MKHVYTAYRARSMCPVCGSEEEVFITNKDFVTDITDYDKDISFFLNVAALSGKTIGSWSPKISFETDST